MGQHIGSNSFNAGVKVHAYPPGSMRPEEGTGTKGSRIVAKDGTVAFDVKDAQVGQRLWLAADNDGEWLAVECLVKEGGRDDAVNVAEELAKTRPSDPPEELVVGARSSRMRTRSTDKPKAPRKRKAAKAKAKPASKPKPKVAAKPAAKPAAKSPTEKK